MLALFAQTLSTLFVAAVMFVGAMSLARCAVHLEEIARRLRALNDRVFYPSFLVPELTLIRKALEVAARAAAE